MARLVRLLLCCALLVASASRADVEVAAGRVVVVIAPSAPSTVRFAAGELTGLLSQVLGADVPLATTPDRAKVNVFLGDSEWTRVTGIDVAKLPRDGFVIDVGKDIAIAGFDDPKADMVRLAASRGGNSQRYARATLFGVYEVLERFAGVRFYFPGELGTILPRTGVLKVPAGRIESRPDWKIRYYSHMDYSYAHWFAGMGKSEWRRATNLELFRLRMETEHVPCCHGQEQEHLTERFAATHPEYFHMERGGSRRTRFDPKRKEANSQLCHTSGVWEEIYRDARSYLLGEDASVRQVWNRNGKWSWGWNAAYGRYFDIMPNDGMFKCHCAPCQAAYAKAKDPKYWATELIWGNTKKVAERLLSEGVPGFVTQMAYGSYRGVPDFSLPTNVMVMVAEEGPWATARQAEWDREVAELKAWSAKVKGGVWMWNYPGKYDCAGTTIPDVSCSTPHAMGKFLKSVAPHVTGAYQESECDRFFFAHLPLYVFSRIAWDNSADPEAIIAEYLRLMFGAGAKAMDEYIRIQEHAWTKKIVGRTVDTAFGPSVTPPTEYELWNKVYSAKVTDRLAALLDEAEAAVPKGSLEARRVALYRAETFDPLMARRKAYLDSTDIEQEKAYRTAHPDLRNIVGNGDFTDAKTNAQYKTVRGGWILNKGEIVYDDREFVSPPHSLRITCTDTSTDVTPETFWRAYATRVLKGSMKPNTRYRLSYYVKLGDIVQTRRRGGVTMVAVGSECRFFPEKRLHGTTPWIRQSFEFTTGAKLSEKGLPPCVRPMITEAYGTVWFDDIRLDELPQKDSD